MSKVNERRRFFAAQLSAAGLDLSKDFFELDFSQVAKVDEIRKLCRYDGTNYLGRSRCRQFWYAAQSAK